MTFSCSDQVPQKINFGDTLKVANPGFEWFQFANDDSRYTFDVLEIVTAVADVDKQFLTFINHDQTKAVILEVRRAEWSKPVPKKKGNYILGCLRDWWTL